MKSRFHKFNIYLALAAFIFAAGCGTYRKEKKFAKEEQSTIRLYLEGNRGDVAGTGTVMVGRDRFQVTVDREPFLKEDDLRRAAMINEPGPNGGYSIELQFNEHGALMLDMLTTANKGRKIVIFSEFPHPGTKAPKAPKKAKKAEDDQEEEEQYQEVLPQSQPEMETPDKPRVKAWLAAVLIRERISSGIFRFSPDASREETARIVRGLKNDIAYEKLLESN